MVRVPEDCVKLAPEATLKLPLIVMFPPVIDKAPATFNVLLPPPAGPINIDPELAFTAPPDKIDNPVPVPPIILTVAPPNPRVPVTKAVISTFKVPVFAVKVPPEVIFTFWQLFVPDDKVTV